MKWSIEYTRKSKSIGLRKRKRGGGGEKWLEKHTMETNGCVSIKSRSIETSSSKLLAHTSRMMHMQSEFNSESMNDANCAISLSPTQIKQKINVSFRRSQEGTTSISREWESESSVSATSSIVWSFVKNLLGNSFDPLILVTLTPNHTIQITLTTHLGLLNDEHIAASGAAWTIFTLIKVHSLNVFWRCRCGECKKVWVLIKWQGPRIHWNVLGQVYSQSGKQIGAEWRNVLGELRGAFFGQQHDDGEEIGDHVTSIINPP